MKYGVVVFEKTENIGDDIQSYAAAQLLPSVDYYIEREQLDVFRPQEAEPVNTIMNGWFMHNKLAWPVSNCINPLYISMHFMKDDPMKIGNTFLQGIGGEDLKTHAPIGCRDLETQAFLEENGIPTYFSGCLTLTLQAKFPKLDVPPYVCLVDVSPDVVDYVKTQYPDIETRIVEHEPNAMPALVKQGATWEERFETVEKLLTIYQNAHAVITSRLHCALPSMALGTPVLLLTDIGLESGRYDGLSSLVHSATTKDFLAGSVSFSLDAPPSNPDTFIPIRSQLIERVRNFVAENQNCTPELKARFEKYDSEWEKRAVWKNEVLSEVRNTINGLELWRMKDMAEAVQWLEQQQTTHRKIIDEQSEYIRIQTERIEQLENEKNQLQSILETSRYFRFVRKMKSMLKAADNTD